MDLAYWTGKCKKGGKKGEKERGWKEGGKKDVPNSLYLSPDPIKFFSVSRPYKGKNLKKRKKELRSPYTFIFLLFSPMYIIYKSKLFGC